MQTRTLRLMWPRALKMFFGLLLLGAFAAKTLALDGMINIHDPSTVMQSGGSYYVFGTGRGITVLTSSNGFDFQRGPKVFEHIPDSVKQYVPLNNGTDVWAPDIIRLNENFYLYYSISKWDSFVSAVGLMTNPVLDTNSPDYKWTDCGMVVHSVEGEKLNAIDPGICQAPDGSLWICYGSYHGNIELVELNPQTGLRIATNSPVTIIASQSEAADIIHHDGFFYLFVNHGSCCQGTNSTYHIRVGRAKKITGPYLDRHGEDLKNGAGTLFLAAEGNNIGPGHFGLLLEDGVEKFSCHYEGQTGRAGRSLLDIRPLLWTLDGWPLAGQNVRAGNYQIRSQRFGAILQTRGATNENAVLLARYFSRDHQKWNIVPAGGGCYKITGVKNGEALQAMDGRLDTASFTGADAQLWKLDQLTDASYRIATKTGRLALTAKAPDGIALSPFTGDDAQRWNVAVP